MKILFKMGLLTAIAAVFFVFSGSEVQAREFKMTAGSSHPPVIPWVGTIKDHVVPQSVIRLKAMGGQNTIKWTEAYAGALYNFKNTLEGVQDGLADIGWVGSPVGTQQAAAAECDLLRAICRDRCDLPA